MNINPSTYSIIKNSFVKSFIFLVVAMMLYVVPIYPSMSFYLAQAQTSNNTADSIADPTKKDFRLVSCDGPDLSRLSTTTRAQLIPTNEAEFIKKYGHGFPYVPCDFNGAMGQIRHLINVLIIAGIFVAIIGFSIGGYFYTTGVPSNIERAKLTFRNVAIGLGVMLAAWFIVYQILSWLAANQEVTALLGK